VETTTKPIEVLLSRPHLEVNCRIAFPDGTAIAVGVDALSLRGAQREMTAWLTEQGYEPTGEWSTRSENGRRVARTFRRQDSGPAADLRPVQDLSPAQDFSTAQDLSPARDPSVALPTQGAPWQPPLAGHGPGLEPAAGPARRAVPRTRRPADGRADRGRASSPLAAETELRAWALANAQRDDAIRAAAAAGVSLPRIQEITGIARTTIMRILGAPPRPAPRKT